ncbi:MAG: hypothetical protein ACK5C5_06975 [Bacteroidota bacterium]|jgi:hypothetical protein
MKINKIIRSVALASFCLLAVPALAQSDENTSNDSGDATESSTSTDPAATTESTEGTGNYNDRVTIDENASTAEGASTESSSFTAAPERKERIRVYSGKHDGNNVISDPR